MRVKQYHVSINNKKGQIFRNAPFEPKTKLNMKTLQRFKSF